MLQSLVSMKSKKQKKSVFFIGIGGIGISALARWYRAQKWAVSGSDLIPSEIIRELKKEGCTVKIGHKKANLGPKTGLVVYNQAIPKNNPELVRARELEIPTLTYPEALGQLTRWHKTIAVTGAHGKSTTTAMMSLVAIKAGLDPTVIIGTKLKEFKNKNFRAERSIPLKSTVKRGIDTERCSAPANVVHYLIIEADEFHASFHNYSPTFAIITNIDREHLDFYKNLTNIKRSFLKFIGNIKKNGTLVVNAENKILWGLKKQVEKICAKNKVKILWYGTQLNKTRKPGKLRNSNNRLLSYDREIEDGTRGTAVEKIRKVLKVPGKHNVSNALAVYTLARALKIPEKEILSALSSFRGSWRRMEYKGKFKLAGTDYQSLLFDDYAHHPTEIKATLSAFRGKYPKHKLICVFQPHQAKRLQALFKEFQKCFSDADALVLLPIYKVPGRDKPASFAKDSYRRRGKLKYTSELLAKTIRPSGHLKEVRYAQSPARLRPVLKSLIINHSVVVMMGAGDIVEYSKYFYSFT